VFCSTVASYLVSVLPLVTRELSHWQARALSIPDPVLRANAVEALSKRGNMEGAALFAVLAPRAQRRETVRALVAFQAAYNYLDVLVEQPGSDPVARAHQLHQGLLVALDADAQHPDYYARYPHREDGGYLVELLNTCRGAFATLPSQPVARAVVTAAAERIVAFQSLNLTKSQGDPAALERWARDSTVAGSGLSWWQTAAAGGSSLAVHALIATAASPGVGERELEAVEAAYFPWICALHSLLDSLVDIAEDEQAGQRNLLSYASPQATTCAVRTLAAQATEATRLLPRSREHRVILTAMVSYYVSSPTASTPYARDTADGVKQAVAPLADPALALFKARRLAARAGNGAYR
jgi:tetraprenyl-beta-curcumene synthase